MDIETILLFLMATLAVNLSPGPSILYVTTVAVSSGMRAAIASVLGVAVGVFFHVLAAAAGVSALLATSVTAFTIVKYLGAIYLIYLGLRLWASARNHDSHTPAQHSLQLSNRRFFWRGVLVDLLNPKIGLFFLALLPQFMHSTHEAVFVNTLILGTLFILMGAMVNTCMAIIAIKGFRRLRYRWQKWVEHWIPGGILIAMGIRLAIEKPEI